MAPTGLPVYLRIAEDLKRDIRDQVYQIGDQLPTESALSERFKVNRHTLRQAIAVLRQEGLLRVEQGRGTFVTAAPIRYAIGKRVRYNQSLKAQGIDAQYQLIKCQAVDAEVPVAQVLAIEPGRPVALIERLSFSHSLPLSLSSGYFPLNRFPDILTEDSIGELNRLGSISQWLHRRYGCDHIRQQTSVSARIVKPEDAGLLQLPLHQPILLAESINVDQTGQVVEYGVTRFRGDRMELVFKNNL